MQRFLFALAALLLLACGGDTTGPPRSDVVGTYLLTTLAFDPQGVLPAVDLLARLGGDVPRLVLAPGGQAQLVSTDPATGLITVANGTYSTPHAAVRIDFGAQSTYRSLLLSRRMTFAWDEAGILSFEAEAPEGVDRMRLLQLVPEFTGEQLLDPVPGLLTIVFTRPMVVPSPRSP